MRVAGVVSVLVAGAALVFLAMGLVGGGGGSWTGYACLAACAVLFGGAGAALLAGSRVMPKNWPPAGGSGNDGTGSRPPEG
jgi:hypothetical protein